MKTSITRKLLFLALVLLMLVITISFAYAEEPTSTMHCGHVESDWQYPEGFNCATGGTRFKICIYCGETLTVEPVESSNHIDENDDFLCDRCGNTFVNPDTPTNGQCGDNAYWSFDISTSTLTISGEGEMWDCSWDSKPWGKFIRRINTVLIEDGITKVGDWAFNFQVMEVLLPESLVSIGKNAFSGVESVSIPKNVMSIGESAFSSFSMKSIIVDKDNLQYSSDDNGCLYNKSKTMLIQYPIGNSRSSFIVPDSVEIIGKEAFMGSKLADIILPNNLQKIEEQAFSACINLESLVIPENIKYIGNYFISQSNVTSLFIPASVEYIGQQSSCFCLESYTVDENNEVYTSDTNGCLYNKERTVLLSYPGGNSRKRFSIPEGVTTIGECAFSDNRFLNEVLIPNSVVNIEAAAFSDCTGLTTVVIPESVNCIGAIAFFSNYSSLERVIILNPNCDIYPEEYTFCKDTKIFGYNGSTAQTYSENFGKTFVALDTISTSGQCGNNAYWSYDVITATLTISGTGEMWDFSPENLASYAMYGQQIISVVIEEGITGIGECAFIFPGNGYDESQIGGNLTEVTIPTSVTKIGSAAFSNCYYLQEVIIPDSVTNIGNSAFEYCKALQHVILPANLTTLEWGAFLGCTSLLEIEIPESVETIGADEFMLCDSLQKVVFYNPDCVFEDEFEVDDQVFQDRAQYALPEATVIYGYSGSTAQEYAETFGRTFVVLDAIPTSGQCGENAYWSYDEATATLTISGTGEMWSIEDQPNQAIPWLAYLTDIETCVIEEGIVNVGSSAFGCAYRLKEVVLPQSLKSIDNLAFARCTRLERIVLPNGLQTIENEAFTLCASLKTLPLPDTITSIGTAAFSTCTSLKSIKLPAGLTTLEDGLFASCFSLKTVEIPASVTAHGEQIGGSIGNMLFYGCLQLEEIANRSATLVCADRHFTRCSFPDGFDFELYIQYVGVLTEERVLREYIWNGEENPSYVAERFTEIFGEDYETVLQPVISDKRVQSLSMLSEMPEGLTFSCNNNSAEHRYCESNGIAFRLLDYVQAADAATGVTVSYDKDAFEEGTELVVTEIDTGSENSRAWNITPTLNGQKVQPSKPVQVKLPIPAGWDKSKLVVVHVDENGNTEYPEFTVEGDFVVFMVSRFSKYSIEKKTETTPDNPPAPSKDVCKWCGKTHEGFFQKIIGFFHNILAAILGAKY